MEMNKWLTYLIEKGVFKEVISCEPITLGAGGAKLFTINTGNKKYVLKIAHESFRSDAAYLSSYQKELAFYRLNQQLQLPYIPKVVYCEHHPEYGILLVMEYYEAISHEQWNLNFQKQTVDICARFNSIPVDKVAPLGLEWNPTQIDKEFTHNAYLDWVEILEEHGDKFDRKLLDEIYENIKIVCDVLNKEPQYLCHGDFHPENVLTDGKQLYICDWQGVNIGKSVGDISFFISRGMGFGIPMDEEILLDYYCERLSEYTGTPIEKTTLLKEKAASNLLTTFSFWAHYLKGSSYEAVAGHFEGMVRAYHCLHQ